MSFSTWTQAANAACWIQSRARRRTVSGGRRPRSWALYRRGRRWARQLLVGALPFRMPGWSGMTRPSCSLPGCATRVDYEARDEEPVDIVILVLWPEASPEGFLPALSETCRAVREPQALRRLRAATSAEEVAALLDRYGRPAAPDRRRVPDVETSGGDGMPALARAPAQ